MNGPIFQPPDSSLAQKQALAFSRLGRGLGAARTPTEAARSVIEAAELLFSWDGCVFDLVSHDQKQVATILYIDTRNGKRTEFTPETAPRPISSVARRVMQKGAELVSSTSGYECGLEGLPFGDKDWSRASLMCVPLRVDNRTLGLLSLQSHGTNAFTKEDLSALQDLADHCGGTLERIRAEAEKERLNGEFRAQIEEFRQLNLELEHRVQGRTAQLAAINKELEAFCYSVSHDLRAPLRSIRGFSEVLLERYSNALDARGQEFLRRACQSCEHMDGLIEDLLKLSRMGRAELKLQHVNLSSAVESIIADLRKLDPGRHVEILVTQGLETYGDERLLHVALDNLLRNAWKFTTKEPRACIEFGVITGTEPAFFVRDNGVGFDMSYANRLFGVFQRLHSPKEFPGGGVGLATVQRVINRHGGRVWAEGAVGKGATFFFSIPSREQIEDHPAFMTKEYKQSNGLEGKDRPPLT